MVVMSDNGGHTVTCWPTAASNEPLRDGKCSIWEGGVRADGFLAGPALDNPHVNIPHPFRTDDLFHVVDWLPTLAHVAKATPQGRRLDGLDQLPNLQNPLHNKETARHELHIGYGTAKGDDGTLYYYGPAIRY